MTRPNVLRLVVDGPHTTILSSKCSACPYSPAGCCVAPPRIDLSDIGRIVSLGGRDWLLAEIAAKRLVPNATWLVITRRKQVLAPGGPREAACIYHGDSGCTIPHERRSATCNYYVCDEATQGDGGERARSLHATLVDTFVGWDAELNRRLTERCPNGPVFDASLLDWLGAAFDELDARGRDGNGDCPPSGNASVPHHDP